MSARSSGSNAFDHDRDSILEMMRKMNEPPQTAAIQEFRSESSDSSDDEPAAKPFIDKLHALNYKIDLVRKEFYESERENQKKSKSESLR